jgi:hypothetical protein
MLFKIACATEFPAEALLDALIDILIVQTSSMPLTNLSTTARDNAGTLDAPEMIETPADCAASSNSFMPKTNSRESAKSI